MVGIFAELTRDLRKFSPKQTFWHLHNKMFPFCPRCSWPSVSSILPEPQSLLRCTAPTTTSKRACETTRARCPPSRCTWGMRPPGWWKIDHVFDVVFVLFCSVLLGFFQIGTLDFYAKNEQPLLTLYMQTHLYTEGRLCWRPRIQEQVLLGYVLAWSFGEGCGCQRTQKSMLKRQLKIKIKFMFIERSRQGVI